MTKSNISDDEINALMRRVKAHIKNSKDFKNSILLLIEEEEDMLLFKNFNTPHPDSKKTLSELLMSQKSKFSELEKSAIDKICEFLKQTEKEYKEIELLQGNEKEIRVKQFKNLMFKRLVKSSSVTLLMNSDYTNMFENEMKKYYQL